MSRMKDIVECKKCHAILQGDHKQLQMIGGIGGGVGGFFGFLTVYALFERSMLAIPLAIAAVSGLLICAIVQNRILKLKLKS
jgi:hypothetical protein